ncbi:hypothetical protein B0T21DRAFT_346888 [Apiosordaria backusii]|uniref:DNA-binding protein n=1 Tax=Apiosordaria backusii TaxID=314023 RepID=A0AA40BSQ0_9PEZI|nr:hypothetical protein B0T21DRAFT_346888 [Apiosordaria backusii]
MVKDTSTVIQEFNQLVNMTAPELEDWLKTSASTSSGWKKAKDDDGESGGESVGHESGRRILEILRRNPDRDPEGYDEGDIPHMRKVVGYCKRHLAQEEGVKRDTGSRSYRSLKNWGHDALKD